MEYAEVIDMAIHAQLMEHANVIHMAIHVQMMLNVATYMAIHIAIYCRL